MFALKIIIIIIIKRDFLIALISYLRYKNFQRIKVRTINFGEKIFEHIFGNSHELIFGQIAAQFFKSRKNNYVRSLVKLTITLEGIRQFCLRFAFAIP